MAVDFEYGSVSALAGSFSNLRFLSFALVYYIVSDASIGKVRPLCSNKWRSP